VLTLAISPHLRMVIRLLKFGVRLVINQSVVPMDLELSPKEWSVFPLSTS
jgi:hypothetical protein